MPVCECKKIIEIGLKVGDSKIFEEDKIWSKYSNDKVDIGEKTVGIIRKFHKSLPLKKKMFALSIGSSNEPQFRILEAAFRGGLYLLDIEKAALDLITERVFRQKTAHVKTILGDYCKVFFTISNASDFRRTTLDENRMNLVTLHHSLYYCIESEWMNIFKNLYTSVLADKGAIHAVLMASESEDGRSTTWLYNKFVNECFGGRNTQDMYRFKKYLLKEKIFKNSRIELEKSRVYFMPDDFGKFMAVVWMVLLYPEVHSYSLNQRERITEYMYKNFWAKKLPLTQTQDHLVIYRGIDLPD